MNAKRYDVILIGAWMGGWTAVTLLAKGGWKTLRLKGCGTVIL